MFWGTLGLQVAFQETFCRGFSLTDWLTELFFYLLQYHSTFSIKLVATEKSLVEFANHIPYKYSI